MIRCLKNICDPIIFRGVISYTSSGTARTLLNPLRKTTKTRLAPQRKADVAQSKAVSPAPKTMTVPCRDGNEDLQWHIPDIHKYLFKKLMEDNVWQH